MDKYKRRRIIAVIMSTIAFLIAIFMNTPQYSPPVKTESLIKAEGSTQSTLAIDALRDIEIKGRAPKTGYERSQFGDGWIKKQGCDMRNIILNRDLDDVIANDKCQVASGTLKDPYTNKVIAFKRGDSSSSLIQIDHVVALSDAWQKGAQFWLLDKRIEFANDPLELIAVDGQANQQKGDGDAATWLPPNKSFRCQYISRQIAVKRKYGLWVTQAEYEAMTNILSKCEGQLLPTE